MDEVIETQVLEEGKRLCLEEKPRYTRFAVINEGEEGPTKVSGILSVAGQVNLNSRLYSRTLWEKCLPNFNANIAQHPGLVDHPEGSPSVADIGILWEKVYLDGDNVVGEGTIVRTRKGSDLEAAVLAGVEVGVSSRGWGQVAKKKVGGKDVWVVDEEQFDLGSFDAVCDPSEVRARLRAEETAEIPWDAITVESLQENRPDVVEALRSMEQIMDVNETPEQEEVTEVEATTEEANVVETAEDIVAEEETEVTETTEDSSAESEVVEEAEVTEAVIVESAELIEARSRIAELEAERDGLKATVENLEATAAELTATVDVHKLHDFIREKCKTERNSTALAEKLIATCKTEAEVNAAFDVAKESVPVTEAVTKAVIEDKEVRKADSVVEKAFEYVSRYR